MVVSCCRSISDKLENWKKCLCIEIYEPKFDNLVSKLLYEKNLLLFGSNQARCKIQMQIWNYHATGVIIFFWIIIKRNLQIYIFVQYFTDKLIYNVKNIIFVSKLGVYIVLDELVIALEHSHIPMKLRSYKLIDFSCIDTYLDNVNDITAFDLFFLNIHKLWANYTMTRRRLTFVYHDFRLYRLYFPT